MKTILSVLAILVLGLGLPETARAKGGHSSGGHSSGGHSSGHRGGIHLGGVRVSQGYNGHGYYNNYRYGGHGYSGSGYYRRPANSWYSLPFSGPRYYYGYPSTSIYRSTQVPLNEAVQIALARRGYYRGTIDGIVGPGHRAFFVPSEREQALDWVQGGKGSTHVQ